VLGPCRSLDELIQTLDSNRKQLWIPGRVSNFDHWASEFGMEDANDGTRLVTLGLADLETAATWDGPDDGLAPGDGIAVTPDVLRHIVAELKGAPTSEIGKRSTRPIERAFVYVDISDYSRMPDGIQLLVVLALVQIAEQAENTSGACTEAKLCIGDGYIYSFDTAKTATIFAMRLLQAIEAQVAQRKVPEFHVRIGVHTGKVRWFRDPGRSGWNYIGAGINGGNRVLSAIGKDTDDVAFVSSEVRQSIRLEEPSSSLLRIMQNRGRRADKHGNLWRVYELNHSAF
jgi:class 3 adenylate cyclase